MEFDKSYYLSLNHSMKKICNFYHLEAEQKRNKQQHLQIYQWFSAEVNAVHVCCKIDSPFSMKSLSVLGSFPLVFDPGHLCRNALLRFIVLKSLSPETFKIEKQSDNPDWKHFKSVLKHWTRSARIYKNWNMGNVSINTNQFKIVDGTNGNSLVLSISMCYIAELWLLKNRVLYKWLSVLHRRSNKTELNQMYDLIYIFNVMIKMVSCKCESNLKPITILNICVHSLWAFHFSHMNFSDLFSKWQMPSGEMPESNSKMRKKYLIIISFPGSHI